MLRLRFLLYFVMATMLMSGLPTLAQDAVGVRDAVPVALSEYDVIAISESTQYYAIGRQNVSVRVFDIAGEEIANFGFLYTNNSAPLFSPPQFIGDDEIVVSSPFNPNISPKLHSLPDGAELARLVVSMYDWDWVTVGEDFWYYIVPDFNLTQARLFYQPIGGDAILISNQLGYSSGFSDGFDYFGGVVVSPDGGTIYVGSLNGIIVWDVASQERIDTLPFPSATNLALSPDGRYLSTTSNSGANWRVIDLESGEEVYSNQSQGRSVGMVRHDGAYIASSRGLSDAGNGILSVVDLSTGDELLNVEGAYTGDIRGQYGGIMGERTAYNWLGEHLFFLREAEGEGGLITIFHPESGDLIEMDTFGFPYGVAPFKTPWLNITPDGQAIEIGLSLNELGFYNTAGELQAVLPVTERIVRPQLSQNGYAIGNVVYAIPDADTPALPVLNGVANSDNLNVRSYPSENATRINGASGDVTAVARNNAGTWVLLSSHGGWVASSLVTLEGDINDLTVFVPAS